MSWYVEIPAPAHVSLNDRNHWSVDADVKAQWRLLAKNRARKIPKGQGRVAVRLHARPPTNHRRDEVNLTPNLKAAVDGLVDAGIIADDTPEHLEDLGVRLHPAKRGEKRWRWVLEVVPAEPRDDSDVFQGGESA